MSVMAQLPPELGGASGKVRVSLTLSAYMLKRPYFRWRTSILKVLIAPYDAETYSCLPSSTGTFRPDRIRSIADRFGVDGNMALENILYGTVIYCFKIAIWLYKLLLQRGHSILNIKCVSP